MVEYLKLLSSVSSFFGVWFVLCGVAGLFATSAAAAILCVALGFCDRRWVGWGSRCSGVAGVLVVGL
jgi:hypothetical protein